MRVLVIGGGIVGLTIAREFQKRGESEITVFERGRLGKESSYAAAGMLAPQAESDADDAFFRFCIAARDFYTEFAEEIENETKIEIGLDRAGTLYAAFDESDQLELSERFEWQKKAGLEVEMLTARETHKLEPFISPDSIGSLCFPNDWQVENRAILKALAKGVTLAGAKVYEGTAVAKLRFENETVTGVESEEGTIFEGDLIVLATGAWTSLIETDRSLLELPEVKPVRGQMISYKTAKRLLAKVIYSPRGYLVPRSDGRILAGATVENVGFDKAVTESGLNELERAAAEIVPSLINLRISENWSGLRPRAFDGLPLIGGLKGGRNLYLSTGHYRNGILLAPLSARLLVDAILGKPGVEHLDSFSPNRFSNAAANG